MKRTSRKNNNDKQARIHRDTTAKTKQKTAHATNVKTTT